MLAAPARSDSEKVASAVTPGTVAVTVNAPAVVPAVRSGLVVTPFASVWAVAAAPAPAKFSPAPAVVTTAKWTCPSPPRGPRNCGHRHLEGDAETVADLSRLVIAGGGNYRTDHTHCGVSEVKVRRECFAEPFTVAVTTKEPATSSAVKVGDVAIPLADVDMNGVVVTPPANVPPAPLVGAVNTTSAPATGHPAVSITYHVKRL